MKEAILFIICYAVMAASILIRYLMKPETNGPIWFVIMCEVILIAGIVRTIMKAKKEK